MNGPVAGGPVRYGTAPGRWVLTAAVVGSGLAALDATVVNVALPAIGRDLGTGLAGLQWVITGYLLSLASLILLGGALGDRYGRRRVFTIGVAWFTAASLLCGLAPNVGVLVAARVLQGVGGALLTPGSLAIIEASFAPTDRARAIGAWTGLGGVATAIGPFAGGYLIEALSWRWIFLLNVPVAAIALLAARHVPESSNPALAGPVDLRDAALGVVGLAGVTYALIEGPAGAPTVRIVAAAAVGLIALAVFGRRQQTSTAPMVPLDLFRSRQFSSANLVTAVVYAALGGVFFLLAVVLQVVLGYSPLEAGASLLPVTVIMLTLSARAGALAQRIGPRVPMTLGPVIIATGLVAMTRIAPGGTYVATVLPAVVVFALGLALTVAPLTATVLGAAPTENAGVASGINNAVARVAGLLAVAVLPTIAGLGGDVVGQPSELADGFHQALLVAAGSVLLGAVIAWLGIRNPVHEAAVADRPYCAVDAPPMRRVVCGELDVGEPPAA